MNRNWLAACAGMTMVASAGAQQQAYTIDTRHSHITWTVTRAGTLSFTGKLVGNSGRIVLDPQAGRGEIEVKIDTREQVTGIAGLDRQIRAMGLFNTSEFPSAQFTSKQVVFKDQVPQRIDGELTLLGVTKPVTLTVTRYGCGRNPIFGNAFCGADATTTIRRSDWGMTGWSSLVGDEVRLDVAVEAHPE
ncbi:MAG: polyisoprenoid-binding protein [Burkholderiales bacterium]|nr:polyisoprenoid-binding protein [Burkholderiales bacterium]